MSKRKTTQRGRDAGSGKFIPVDKARKQKNTAVVERVPVRTKKK
ncbi:MAG TPA: hypothetical protein VGB22_04245 [candidate division Zixibacteria bacterium]|jgi:hypothetical protein